MVLNLTYWNLQEPCIIAHLFIKMKRSIWKLNRLSWNTLNRTVPNLRDEYTSVQDYVTKARIYIYYSGSWATEMEMFAAADFLETTWWPLMMEDGMRTNPQLQIYSHAQKKNWKWYLLEPHRQSLWVRVNPVVQPLFPPPPPPPVTTH